ncbi:hypothetical protein P691DRAFT_768085 [Macrolepiota fuliginosa MF-IS2]|uniref:Uncharacterized protein n=1 Tax=Macrolepiota fuliginosa MF-IS2 TaxID=1400762 RepID=A0A9P6BV35_9AGAR|nr:hypothetical protein P691DRAFT_768085 [Macrolepiota fuliginosa MF-IS2]
MVLPTEIITASIEELESEFQQAHNVKFLDGSMEDHLMIYANGVQPLNAYDPAFVNAVWLDDTTNAPTFVSAVMYNTEHLPSYVMEEDSDDLYVLPPSAPLPKDHLLWPCLVDRPATPSACVQALIDHGCPIVLILYKLVEGLCLHHFTLQNPLSLGGIGGGTFSCTQYVKLHLCSVDSV